MKKEIQLLEYKGKTILFLDFSNCSCKEDYIPVIESSKLWLRDKAPGSVLTLTDVTEAHFDANIVNLLKELTSHNKPYVKAGAVVGITRPLMKLAYNAVMAFSNRNLPIFDTRDQAKEWLVNQ